MLLLLMPAIAMSVTETRKAFDIAICQVHGIGVLVGIGKYWKLLLLAL